MTIHNASSDLDGGLTPALKQRLSRALARVEGVADGLGHRIDPGIRQAVAMLNELGINTHASCEGHVDWATGGPYIDIVSPQYLSMRHELRALGEGPSLVDQRACLREKMKVANAVEGKKVLPILDEFYKARESSYETRIGLWFYGAGITRLESVGVAFLGAESDPAAKIALLRAFQSEMTAFSNFLVAHEPAEALSPAMGAARSQPQDPQGPRSSLVSSIIKPSAHRIG